MNITDPIYADEDKAREHSDRLQATEPVDQGNGRRGPASQCSPTGRFHWVCKQPAHVWPIANCGCVPMPITPDSYWRNELKCPAVRAASVVQVCPRGGTYCRSSSQIAHCRGATLLGVLLGAAGSANERVHITVPETGLYR